MPELLFALRVLLVVILYTFLTLTIYTLWLDLKAGEARPTTTPSPASLIVESGETSDRSLILQPITALGRAADNTLILTDPFASSHHALILWREGRWWLEDLKSHNGTRHNKEQISEPIPLTSGDQIQIGETTLRFETGIKH